MVAYVFAVADGFASWREMRDFWRVEHPGIDRFQGVWVRWRCLEGGMLAETSHA